MTTPSNSLPTCFSIHAHLKRSSTSRSASSARRSRCEQCIAIAAISARAVACIGRLAAGQRIADRAMHQQVGIAADRRGEVRVRLVAPGRSGRCCPGCTPPAAASAAARLEQRAHRGGRGSCVSSSAKSAGVTCVRRRHAQLELAQELPQVLVLLRRRRFVHAVQRGDLLLARRNSPPQTLAASMHSSISLCASLRRCAPICDRSCRCSSRRTASRVVSKSIAPRRCARLRQHLVQRVQVLQVRQHVRQLRARASASSSPIACHTSCR